MAANEIGCELRWPPEPGDFSNQFICSQEADGVDGKKDLDNMSCRPGARPYFGRQSRRMFPQS